LTHDGVLFPLKPIVILFVFDWVESAIKVLPPIENEIVSFYTIDENNKFHTAYDVRRFFLFKKSFKNFDTWRQNILLRDTNNVVDFFNHNTDTVSSLKDNINEFAGSFDAVADNSKGEF
jgi:hypothetical protein